MAFTMSRLSHLVGRPIRPFPEYVGIRSAISSHSSSVKSPWVDRQVVAMGLSLDPIIEVYEICTPESGLFGYCTGHTSTTASEPSVGQQLARVAPTCPLWGRWCDSTYVRKGPVFLAVESVRGGTLWPGRKL